MTADDVQRPPRAAGGPLRSAFEKERGVTDVFARGAYSCLTLRFAGSQRDATPQLAVYRALAEHGISINLVKLFPGGLTFVVDAHQADAALGLLEETLPGSAVGCIPSVTMVSVYAAGMRSLYGIMARIARALLRAGVPIVQTGDGPDTVFVLVPSPQAAAAVTALREEFRVPPPAPRIVVQKFGGRSVGTEEARRLAAERVREVLDAGYRPVVVVSAIGRMGEPYATDTLLAHLRSVDPDTEPEPREQDLLMACGEIISTVIMAQTLKAMGLRTKALTGGQAGILTDYRYGDAQIIDINPAYLRRLLEGDEVDVVVVAGFQGVTTEGAITTLGRGGSDTTAAALGAALGAERVEIYTHVDGVMTADPEVEPSARTLSLVTYEEVTNMAHQGAKVLHPRAAEIAMLHQIPLWVKNSFRRAPGTLVAPLAALQPPVKRAVTGVATLAHLVYFTITGLDAACRAEQEYAVYAAIGNAGINFYLNSMGPQTSSFIVEQDAAARTAGILRELGLRFELNENCEMVSVVALNMWEEPGFLWRIASALAEAGLPVLQMADSECSVACLVHAPNAPAAVRTLHAQFGLGTA